MRGARYVRAAADRVVGAPGVRHVGQWLFDWHFNTARHAHLFRGVYPSFEAAAAKAPKRRALGYDNAESAGLYVNMLNPDMYDYAPFFWLAQSFRDGLRRVVDLGGSIGIKYYAFRKLLPLPAGMSWCVIDVPAAVRRGRDFARLRSAEGLEFSDDPASADGCDVLYTSGALQYLPRTLPEMLAGYASKPRRIVVNTTPIHPTLSFVTLNNIGTAYCPYRVQARDTFVQGVCAQGYTLRDDWSNTGKRMRVAFDPAHSVDAYSGFCFDALTR